MVQGGRMSNTVCIASDDNVAIFENISFKICEVIFSLFLKQFDNSYRIFRRLWRRCEGKDMSPRLSRGLPSSTLFHLD